MKKLNKILLEIYSDRKQILFVGFLGYVGYLMQDLIPSDPNIIQATGVIWGAAIMGTVTIAGMIMKGSADKKARDAMSENNELVAQQARDQLAFQKEQQAKLDKQKAIYRAMEFKNPYENMENAYEDLTVNQQQAQFQAEQGQQQRANIMRGLRGAAGGSGIAGLAQTMASQGQLQTQQISAQIGMQEQRNQILRAKGAEARDLQERGGEAMLQTMEMDRQATLLGVSMAGSAGANAAALQAQSNQVAAGAAEASMYGQQGAAYGAMAGQAFGAAVGYGTQAMQQNQQNQYSGWDDMGYGANMN